MIMHRGQRWALRFRKIFRGSVGRTATCNSVILGANALTGILCARTLGPSGRGELALALLWTGFIQTIGSLGLLSSCSYHVARWPHRRKALLAWLRRISIRQSAGMVVVSACVLWLLHIRLGLPGLVAVEFTVWAPVTTITLYGACYVQGLGDFKRFNSLRVVPGMLTSALMLISATAVHLTPAEAGANYIAPSVASAIVAFWWLRPASAAGTALPLSIPERRAAWSYALRSLASFSGVTLNLGGDQLILGLLLPTRALGLYSVAGSASTPLVSMMASYGMVGLPTVASLTGPAKGHVTWKTLRRAALMGILAAPVVAVALPWLLPHIYGRSYQTAVKPAEILLIGACFAGIAAVADDLLRAHDHPGFVSISQGLGAAVTITGAILVANRSLGAVALLSAVGSLSALLLAVAKLRSATRSPGLADGHANSRTGGRHAKVRRAPVVRRLRTSPSTAINHRRDVHSIGPRVVSGASRADVALARRIRQTGRHSV
jgi:O-antigen/teichoic acid export membrane protein